MASRRRWRVLIGVILALMAAAFLAPLVIPAPYLVENRVLAEAPAWPKSAGGIRPFVKGVDAYVADNFPIRPHLIGALNRVRLLAGVSGSPRVIVGRDGWLFYNDDSLLGASRGEPRLSREDVRIWLRHLAGRTEALQRQGVPYLVVVPPLKDTLYPQFAPAWSPGPSEDRDALFLPRLAREAGAGEVTYLYDAVAEQGRQGFKTFSRHDTHWTGYGAYGGYAAMIGKLHAMGVTDPPLPMGVFADEGARILDPPADMAKMLGVTDFVRVDYPSLDNPRGWAKAKRRYLTDSTDWTSLQMIDTGETGRPVLLLIRDSFSEALLPLLLPHFSRIVIAHGQDGMWRPELVERYKPDVVVLEVLESGLRSTMQKGPEPSPAAAARVDGIVDGLIIGPAMQVPDRKLEKILAEAQTVTDCHMEAASLRAGRSGDASFTASGWFAPPMKRLGPSRGWVRVRGQGRDFVAAIAFDGNRPDVAAHFRRPLASKSGFVGSYRIADLPKGAYSISLYRRTPKAWVSCHEAALIERP